VGTGAWRLSEKPAPYHRGATVSWESKLRCSRRCGEPGVVSARASLDREGALQRRERDLMGTSYR